MKRNPTTAFWLSVLPGLGHIYLGQVAKGVLFAVLFVALINLADDGPDAFGILIPVYWLVVMLDAHRSTQELNRLIDSGGKPPDPLSLSLSQWWGWSLLGVGLLLLLSNLGLLDLDWVWQFWPLALILLGLKLVRQKSPERGTRDSSSSGASSGTGATPDGDASATERESSPEPPGQPPQNVEPRREEEQS